MEDPIHKLISTEQLVSVLKEVHQLHKWPMHGRGIKYIDLHYDNRNDAIFTIVFRQHGSGPQTVFTVTNRFKEGTSEQVDVDLFAEVMDWLVAGRKNDDRTPFLDVSSNKLVDLDEDTIHQISCEIDHDFRETGNLDRIRWNNRAMGSAVRTINKLRQELLEKGSSQGVVE